MTAFVSERTTISEREISVQRKKALNVAHLHVVVADVISLCSQISQELNQVLGKKHTAAATSQQNGEAHVTNGDSTQAQQVCTYQNSHDSFSITTEHCCVW
jgi:hypothetical protein